MKQFIIFIASIIFAAALPTLYVHAQDSGCGQLAAEFDEVGSGESAPGVLPAHCAPAGTWVNRGVQVGLTIAGSVAVLFIIIGAFRYIVSGGSEESASKGKKTMLWAVIGLVVVIMSAVIIKIVTQYVTGQK